MSFFFGSLECRGVMVAGVRDGLSKANKPFVTLTVVDSEGNTNQLSTSEPETMRMCKALQQGDVVDLTIVCAAGPKKQYAMIARGADSIRPVGGSAVGY